MSALPAGADLGRTIALRPAMTMADLGKHISMGLNPPFETTIRVEVKMPNAKVSEGASRR